MLTDNLTGKQVKIFYHHSFQSILLVHNMFFTIQPDFVPPLLWYFRLV